MPTTMTAKQKSTLLSVPSENPLVPGHWSQKPWLRTVMGIVVAQGLFLFLRRCVEAYHLHQIADQLAPLQLLQTQIHDWFALVIEFHQVQPLRNAWSTDQGFFLWQGLQVVALLLGGILAGAGQRGSWQYGGVIGLINGFISLFQLTPYYQPGPEKEALLYAQPLLYVVVGITASLIGAWFWPPLIVASAEDLRKPKETKQPLWKLAKGLFDLRNLKVHWAKSLICAGVAAVGIYYMPTVFDWLRTKLALSEFLYKRHVQQAYVIAVLMWIWVFLCAMAAGASTKFGWIQGFWVGLVSALVFIAIGMTIEGRGLSPNEVPTSFATFLALGVAGGSFGARLLPPILKHKREGPRMTGI